MSQMYITIIFQFKKILLNYRKSFVMLKIHFMEETRSNAWVYYIFSKTIDYELNIVPRAMHKRKFHERIDE